MSDNTEPVAPTEAEVEKKAKVEPSGYYGGNPATAGPGPTAVHSDTPENREGQLSTSAPANTGVTPGSTAKGE